MKKSDHCTVTIEYTIGWEMEEKKRIDQEKLLIQ